MRKQLMSIAVAAVFATVTHAEQGSESVSNFGKMRGIFALECEYYPFKLSDIPSAASGTSSFGARSVLVGTRVNPVPAFGLEILVGGTYNGGHPANMSRSTTEMASTYAIQGRVGVAYRLYGGSHASLWAGVQGGGIYEKVITGYYDNNTGQYTYTGYNTFSPHGVLRIEPSVTLNGKRSVTPSV